MAKTKKKKNFTPISRHKRQGGVLKTKVSDLPLQMIDWEKDLMPEHIWLEMLSQQKASSPWHKAYEEFMDRIDESLERDLDFPLLGLISDFGVLNENERTTFINKNKEFIYQNFFVPVGKILSLFPENPANWLIIDEWKNKEKIDYKVELKFLTEGLSRLINAKDLHAGHIRTIPFARVVKHGKIHLPMDDYIDSLTKYPGGCTEEEKYKVQQITRTHLMTYYMTEDRYKNREWPKYFWRHNLDLVPCAPVEASLDEGDISTDDEMKDLQKKQWNNGVKLMKYLDKIGMQYKYDLYDPLKDEIQLGLFSRIIRLYISFVSNPFFWSRDLSGIFLRCIGETTIIFFYLVRKGTDEEYKDFYNYAMGKEKLLVLHLQDNLREIKSIDGKDISDLTKDLGGGFNAEISDINLKDWTKKNIREMALEVGLENIYRWVIDPSSSEIHGSWSSIRKSNLVICRQILHRFHRIPRFYEPPIYLVPMYVAKKIYILCQNLAVSELDITKPDEELDEIQEIKNAYDKIFEN